MPEFSVIIPTYNRANLISRALASVLQQTLKDFEIIVVDDGSTDDTYKVIKTKFPKVHYFAQENAGPSNARNKGIQESRGRYIAFLDTDDIWYPEKLKKMNGVINQNQNAGLFFSDYQIVNQSKNPLKIHRSKIKKGQEYKRLLMGNYIGTSTVVVNRKCFDTVGLFAENILNGEDWDMWIRISRKFPIVHIPEVLGEYTWQSEGAITTSDEALSGVHKSIINRALKQDYSFSKYERQKIKANFYYAQGCKQFRHGTVDKALENYIRSIKVFPFSYKAYLYLILIYSGTKEILPRRIKEKLGLFQ